LPGLRLEPAARRRAQIEVRLRCAHLIHAIVLQRGGPVSQSPVPRRRRPRID
jgi:hypothetical protein